MIIVVSVYDFERRGNHLRYTKNRTSMLIHCVKKSVQIRIYFWSVFSRIRTEYGEILRIWKNTDQKNSEQSHFSRSVAIND